MTTLAPKVCCQRRYSDRINPSIEECSCVKKHSVPAQLGCQRQSQAHSVDKPIVSGFVHIFFKRRLKSPEAVSTSLIVQIQHPELSLTCRMPCKVPRNSSRQAGSRTKFVVPNPSHDSTLGDVGYRDQKGSWRKIVNLLDTESCELLGIKSLRLARGSPQYVSQAPHAPLGQPFVYTDPGASHRLLSPDELARYLQIRLS